MQVGEHINALCHLELDFALKANEENSSRPIGLKSLSRTSRCTDEIPATLMHFGMEY